MLGLLVVASAGCKPNAATIVVESPPDDRGTAAEDLVAAADRPAFVVIAADNTWVIPVDAAQPIARWPGMFVGDPAKPDTAYGRIQMGVGVAVGFETERELPWCADATLDAACLRDEDDTRAEIGRVTVVRGEGGHVEAEVEMPCDCVAVRGISTDEKRPPEFDLTDPETLEMIKMSGYAPEEYEEYCGAGALLYPLEPTAVLDGVLYRTGTTHNNICSGLNLYDGGSDSIPLRPSAKPLDQSPAPPMRCIPDGAGMGAGLDLSALSPGAEMDCELGGDGCENCDLVGEMTAFANRSGQLVFTAGDIDPVGVGCACAQHRALGGSSCPGPLEPCGDATHFVAAAAHPEFWIATDGSAALAVDGEATRVFAQDDRAPNRSSPPIENLLGVEFHHDTVLRELVDLPSLVGASLPALSKSDAGKTRSTRSWWLRCNELLERGQLEAAEAACVAGLRTGGNRPERAHLVLSLARLEKKRGHEQRAQQFLDRWNRLERSSLAIGGR